MAEADEAPNVRTVALVIIAAVAVTFTFYLGREFFQPIAIAILLNALFRPIVREMEKAKIPTALAAAVVVMALLAALIIASYALAGPVKSWMDSAPQSVEAAQEKFERLRRPMQKFSDVANKIEQATQGPSTKPVAEVSPQGPTMIVRVFGTTTAFISVLAEVLLMLYLLLAAGDLFLQKLIKVMPLARDKANARKTVHEVEVAVAQYMYATLLINLGQAAIVALILKLLGLPHWILWGLATVVLEFIPYLGAALMIVLLSISAFTTFDSIGHILAAPGSYFVITSIQNNVVSPFVYGNHLRLNPVAVLVGVLLWWFLWGIPGAFVSVPILAAVKIISERSDHLKGVGEFLGE